MPIDPLVEAALVTMAGTLASIGFTWWRTRRHDAADTSSLEARAIAANASATLALIQPLEDRITRMNADRLSADLENQKRMETLTRKVADVTAELIVTKERLELSEEDVQDMRNGIEILSGQLKELNVTPRYQPPAARRPGTGPLASKS